MVEEFLGDGFDAEGVFELRERGIILGILQQIEKARLRRVATFALADDVGKAAGRRQVRFDGDFAGFSLLGLCLFAKLPDPFGKVLAILRLYAARTCSLRPTTLPRFRISGNEAGGGSIWLRLLRF